MKRSALFLRSHRLDILCLVGIAVLSFGLQTLSGAHDADLASYSDEPAHFISGLMVFDYFSTAFGSNPIEFAQTYYLHYPKVAIGQWPPVFYVLQALWFGLVGPSKVSALYLLALLGAVLGMVLYLRLAPSYGRLPALLTAALLLLLPLFRIFSSCVMADLPTALFIMLAVFAFSDYLQEPAARHAGAFALFASLALLTKPNAGALAILPVIALPLTGKLPLLKDRKLWLAGLAVLASSVPCYAVLFSMKDDFWRGGFSPDDFPRVLAFYPRALLLAVGPGAAIAAIVGAVVALRRPRQEDPRAVTDARISLAWVLSVLLFLFCFPKIPVLRFLLPALPAVLILSLHGLHLLSEHAPAGPRIRERLAVVLAALLVLATAMRSFPPGVRGYGQVAAAIPDRGAVVLVSADPLGEGAFIVERRIRDPGVKGVVLRASKVLSSSTWTGDGYRLRMHDPGEVRKYLGGVPVQYVVLDDCRPDRRSSQHQELLRRALQAKGGDFLLRGRFSLAIGRQTLADCISLWESRSARGHAPALIRIDMGSRLGKVLELRLK